MATPEETIRNPIYQKLAAIVLDTKSNRRKWRANEERAQGTLKSAVPGSSFKEYTDALDLLAQQIEEARTYYDTESGHWSRAPKPYAGFPHSCHEFRKSIIALTPQYRVVEAEIQRMTREKEAAERARAAAARTRATTAARSAAASPKKPNWWKRIVIGGLLIGGGWFGAKHVNAGNGPKETDKNGVRIENTASTLKQTLGGGVMRSGNVYAANPQELQEVQAIRMAQLQTTRKGYEATGAVYDNVTTRARADSVTSVFRAVSDSSDYALNTAHNTKEMAKETTGLFHTVKNFLKGRW